MYADTIRADGPVGFWRLNEASGSTAADSSGNSHPGTYQATPTLAQGGPLAGDKNSASVLLNGSTQYVSLGTGPAIVGTGALTFEIWCKTTLTSHEQMLVMQRQNGVTNEAYLSIFNSGSPFQRAVWFTYDGSFAFETTVNGGPVITDGNWHHVVATREVGGAGNLYIDGVLVLSAAAGHIANLGAITMDLGWDGFSASTQFSGNLAEAAIYAKALTAGQIANHYQVAQRGGVMTG